MYEGLLTELLDTYGLSSIIAIAIGYGMWKLILKVTPDDILKKVKLFPKRQKILDSMDGVSDNINSVSEQIGTVVQIMLESTEQNRQACDSMSGFIKKLEEVVNSLDILEANMELWKETRKEMVKQKARTQMDQLRKIRYRLRSLVFESLYRALIYMIDNKGETDQLEGKLLDNKIDILVVDASKELETKIKSEVYKDLKNDGVTEEFLVTLDKVLFEKGFIKDVVNMAKPSLRMRGDITTQIESIRGVVDSFHFNVVDKMERMMEVYLSDG